MDPGNGSTARSREDKFAMNKVSYATVYIVLYFEGFGLDSGMNKEYKE